ncbi:hypothetical protein F5B18DRAFT_433215 [Nemania serpens]|nr:hypothetical protein F5B18DRAFT_433215 [Nemania serpens]
MPANKLADGVAPTQSAPTSKRFELPALDFKFGSLTDGTDIPPPPPSPKQEVPPPQLELGPQSPSQPQVLPQAQQQPKTTDQREAKVEEQQPKLAERANGATNGTTPKKPDITVTTKAGLKRTADEGPASPALSSRGSLRRLISKTLLNHAYDEQGSTTGRGTSRPPSRSASFLAEEKKAKRSSGWFWRLRSHDNTHDTKPTALQFEGDTKQPAGPPPPMIPELSALKTKVDTHLGDDLFKGIGRDA